MTFTTENGWPSCGPDQLDRTPVPGTGGKLVIPLQKGIPATIMRAFAADINQYVESLNNARGYTDEGGWTPTNSVATSNHLGGTAMDLNWEDHPMGNADAGWGGSDIIPGNQVPAVRELLKWYEGMIFWGNDWDSPKDSMHFQCGYDTYDNQGKCADFIKRKIRADGFSTFRRAPGPIPAPNLPRDLTDRQLLEQVWDQLRGVGGKGWPQLNNMTLVDAVAELLRRTKGSDTKRARK